MHFVVLAIVSILYSISLLGLATYTSRDSHPWIKCAAIVFGLVFPACFGMDLVTLVQLTSISGCLVAERFFPRQSYSFPDGENLTHAAYFVLHPVAGASFYWLYDFAMRNYDFTGISILSRWPLACQVIALLFALDFKQYWIHRWQHRFTPWWQFHKIHHSSRMLSVLADNRTHYVERYFVQEFSNVFLAHALGASFLAFWLFTLITQPIFAWEHMNMDWPKGGHRWWHILVATPALHATHHSIGDESFNYGEIFLIWDYLFGTYKPVSQDRRHEFGLRQDDPAYDGLGFLGKQIHPFGFLLKSLFSRVSHKDWQ